MDSSSLTSAHDDAKLSRSCSSICLSDTTVSGGTNGCCAKDIVENLMGQVKEKDEQLEKNKRTIIELLAKLDLEKAKTIQAKFGMDELETKLAMAESEQKECQSANAVLQMSLWKSFPLPHLCYYIKAVERNILYSLYADNSGYLVRSSDDRPFPCTGHFKFTKHPNSSFSIYSMSKEKYLECKPETSRAFASSNFSATDCSTINTRFELIFHQQSQLPGMLVDIDIRSLVNDCFLECRKFAQPNSRSAPANKFLIIPVEGQ